MEGVGAIIATIFINQVVHIILYVVVFLGMASIVGFSLLVLTLLLLLPLGALVLLYHLNQSPKRG